MSAPIDPTQDLARLLRSPLTGGVMGPQELANALAHYYRGELSRAISWRDRMDRTTNWAIAAVAAVLSVSLTRSEQHHGLMLFTMALIFLLLLIESRRYRFFDVFRRRMRLFERGYYANVFAPAGEQDAGDWVKELGESIRHPRFSVTLKQAMARRLRRNYAWIFGILLAAWLLKVLGSEDFARLIASPNLVYELARIGWTPGWVVLLIVLGFHGWLAYLMIRHGQVEEETRYGEVWV